MSVQPPQQHDARQRYSGRDPDWAILNWTQDGLRPETETFLQGEPNTTLIRDAIAAHHQEFTSPDPNRALRSYSDTYVTYWNNRTQVYNPVTEQQVPVPSGRALPKGPIFQIFYRGQRSGPIDHVPDHSTARTLSLIHI